MSVKLSNSQDDFSTIAATMPSIKAPIKLRPELTTRIAEDNSEGFKFTQTLELSPRAQNADFTQVQSEHASHKPVIMPSRPGRRVTSIHPSSPCSGVSEECIAMANACSHDHDYFSPSTEVYSPRSQSKETCKRQPVSPGIIVKREQDLQIPVSFRSRERGRPNKTVAIRTRRILLVRKDEVGTSVHEVISGNQDLGDSKIVKIPDKAIERKSKPELVKVESIPILNQDPNMRIKSSKDSNIPNDFESILDVDITSPRPSITPFPPSEKRKTRQGSTLGIKRVDDDPATNVPVFQSDLDKSLKNDNEKDSASKSVDSAYSSLSFSSTSIPRTPSSNRPPSGGKRGATCGLTSSSSSGTSSDEWSDVDSPEKLPHDEELKVSEQRNTKQLIVTSHHGTCNDDGSELSEERSSRKPSPHPPQRKVVSGKKTKKYIDRDGTAQTQQKLSRENLQHVPSPPTRKPKKSKYYRSVPMRLRALPTSFWEEPNRTNPSPYTILPPVQPLFHQQENEDIADIRPVTPPNDIESSRQASSSTACERPRTRTVIRTGDTDLLWRLFDKVEAKQKHTGIRAKRGRPKRPSYCTMPAPRRALNENPCIISSITEKLFPKLTLDSRHPIAAVVTSSKMMSTTRPATDGTPEEVTAKSKLPCDSATVFLSDEECPGPGLSNMVDPTMEMMPTSPSPTHPNRPSQISLPQLCLQKEYSQLLNELAAVL